MSGLSQKLHLLPKTDVMSLNSMLGCRFYCHDKSLLVIACIVGTDGNHCTEIFSPCKVRTQRQLLSAWPAFGA